MVNIKEMFNLRKLKLSQYETVVLNKDGAEIIIVKPTERLMLQLGASLENSIKLLNKLEGNPESVDEFLKIVEKVLTECIRHPDDFRAKIIVPDDIKDENILNYQERFSDFNPVIDNDVLLAQDLITPYEHEKNALGVQAPKIAVFLIILRMMGLLRVQKEAPKQETEEKKTKEDIAPEEEKRRKDNLENMDEIESFPVNSEDTKKVDNK